MAPYKRSIYNRRSPDKYSVEQFGLYTVLDPQSQPRVSVPIVADTQVEGVRKVKHLTINLSSLNNVPVYWALVYVPIGTQVNNINTGGAAGTPIYEPSQFVMNCGVINPGNAGPCRITSRVSRNLHNGDRIYLCLLNASGSPTTIQIVTRYAICFN